MLGFLRKWSFWTVALSYIVASVIFHAVSMNITNALVNVLNPSSLWGSIQDWRWSQIVSMVGGSTIMFFATVSYWAYNRKSEMPEMRELREIKAYLIEIKPLLEGILGVGYTPQPVIEEGDVEYSS